MRHCEFESWSVLLLEWSLWLTEVVEFPLRHADLDAAFQVFDPGRESDGAVRPDSREKTIADVERSTPALQLNRSLLLIDRPDRYGADERPKTLDLLLALLGALVVPLDCHLQRSFFARGQIQR